MHLCLAVSFQTTCKKVFILTFSVSGSDRGPRDTRDSFHCILEMRRRKEESPAVPGDMATRDLSRLVMEKLHSLRFGRRF